MNIYNLLKGEISQQELLNHYNVTITYEKMPNSVDGFVWLYENIYNIFINQELSYYKRKKTILHELAHIELNQLNQIDKDLFAFRISKYEDAADKYIKLILEQIKEENKLN